MELSRQKYEESLLMTSGDAASDVSGSSTSTDDNDIKTEEIPEIVVDPVEDGREVSKAVIDKKFLLFIVIQC